MSLCAFILFALKVILWKFRLLTLKASVISRQTKLSPWITAQRRGYCARTIEASHQSLRAHFNYLRNSTRIWIYRSNLWHWNWRTTWVLTQLTAAIIHVSRDLLVGSKIPYYELASHILKQNLPFKSLALRIGGRREFLHNSQQPLFTCHVTFSSALKFHITSLRATFWSKILKKNCATATCHVTIYKSHDLLVSSKFHYTTFWRHILEPQLNEKDEQTNRHPGRMHPFLSIQRQMRCATCFNCPAINWFV
jgi:hypothetical protein